MNFPPVGLSATNIEQFPTVAVGPGCIRRDLPSPEGVRIWVVEMAPGAVWPHVDHHDAFGENVFVARGVVIEGDQHYGEGCYLNFAPDSQHRPRTEVGVQLFGLNLTPRSGKA